MAMNEFARPNLAVDQLPSANASDSGKVLTADASGVPKWATPSGGLPTVTADDNGDVLTVVEGAWAKAVPSGGGGVLVVHVDWDVGDGTLDKTWQEIHDAALGQVLILSSEYDGALEVYYLQKVEMGQGMTYAVDFAHNSNGSVDWMHFSASSASDYPVWYE